MKIEIATRFPSDDLGCNGDYAEVTVVVNGKKVKTWGDYYHDKGEEKAEAFVEGIEWLRRPKKVQIIRTVIADFEC